MSGTGTKNKSEMIMKEGKRPKPNVSPCDIKTAALFHANYAQHRISEKRKTFQCVSGWNTAEGLLEIKAWLRVVADVQIRMYGGILRSSEAALYPLIITALLPVFDLCDCTAKGNLAKDIPLEDMEQIASEIADSQSRRYCSRQVSAEKAAPSSETEANSFNPDELPDVINTSAERDVLQFMVYIEKWLASSEYATKGRVEILITDTVSKKTKCVVEAKTVISIGDPNDAGFYQCCAYMALQDIPFGIYTDHRTFQFIRMDASRTLHHTQLFELMHVEYDSLNPDAAAVYAHLFEVMGVPRSTDLLASAAASAATWAERAVDMTARL